MALEASLVAELRVFAETSDDAASWPRHAHSAFVGCVAGAVGRLEADCCELARAAKSGAATTLLSVTVRLRPLLRELRSIQPLLGQSALLAALKKMALDGALTAPEESGW